MIGNIRHPGPAVRAGADPASESLARASDSTLIELISRGHEAAFVALFDRTSPMARAELGNLPDNVQPGQILAASYVEVWWLAGCHRAPEADATIWITGIVRRRVGEALRSMRPGRDPLLTGPRPSYSELEFAALLRRPVGDRPGA
ncbi:hypothetical protein M1L60_13315 [Actinoplanes sp. TRM 88003]|uniref:Uncharacterized protein n=1 Tax=Paractinoplanes aksuensis TaxID=2939490 RepID=A0ABT1DM47_9ACTN|nr:hypothetical protein [Actinoplanes aksuensis]MCO8271573.1 hypothetical protein [Actinoplanes aksuensis]